MSVPRGNSKKPEFKHNYRIHVSQIHHLHGYVLFHDLIGDVLLILLLQ